MVFSDVKLRDSVAAMDVAKEDVGFELSAVNVANYDVRVRDDSTVDIPEQQVRTLDRATVHVADDDVDPAHDTAEYVPGQDIDPANIPVMHIRHADVAAAERAASNGALEEIDAANRTALLDVSEENPDSAYDVSRGDGLSSDPNRRCIRREIPKGVACLERQLLDEAIQQLALRELGDDAMNWTGHGLTLLREASTGRAGLPKTRRVSQIPQLWV